MIEKAGDSTRPFEVLVIGESDKVLAYWRIFSREHGIYTKVSYHPVSSIGRANEFFELSVIDPEGALKTDAVVLLEAVPQGDGRLEAFVRHVLEEGCFVVLGPAALELSEDFRRQAVRLRDVIPLPPN